MNAVHGVVMAVFPWELPSMPMSSDTIRTNTVHLLSSKTCSTHYCSSICNTSRGENMDAVTVVVTPKVHNSEAKIWDSRGIVKPFLGKRTSE